MFRNAKVGDRVWNMFRGWGTVEQIDFDVDFPIRVVFDGTEYDETFTFEGKIRKCDINPTLFWDEIKFEIPKKSFNLEEELRRLEIKEFVNGEMNYYLYWSNPFEKIKIDCTMVVEIPLVKYFLEDEALIEFEKKLKNKKITKQQFFRAYKNVFGDKK